MPIGTTRCVMLGSGGVGASSGTHSLVLPNGTSGVGISTSYTPTNQDKAAISFWVKRTSTAEEARPIGMGFGVGFSAADQLEWLKSAISGDGRQQTTATYTDTASWHHVLVHWDTDNATAGDRMRIWWDGSEVTSFDIDNNPDLDKNHGATTLNVGAIGGISPGAKYHQVAFFDDSLPAIADVYPKKSNAHLLGLTGIKALVATSSTTTQDLVGTLTWADSGTAATTDTDIPS